MCIRDRVSTVSRISTSVGGNLKWLRTVDYRRLMAVTPSDNIVRMMTRVAMTTTDADAAGATNEREITQR